MKIKAEYFPFFKYNTYEQVERIAKALIDTPIKIGVIGVEIGKVTNAYVENGRIFWEGEIYDSDFLTKGDNDATK